MFAVILKINASNCVSNVARWNWFVAKYLSMLKKSLCGNIRSNRLFLKTT